MIYSSSNLISFCSHKVCGSRQKLSTRHYTIAMTSSRHHHDIVNTSPLLPRRITNIRLSHAEGSPIIATFQNTSLTFIRFSAE